MAAQLPWWKAAVIYQIFVRSYQDSDGDGTGDLPGLISRLDYIASLGMGAVWLTPIQPSPWLDAGYDITDYCNVHPKLGKLADFDRLIAEAGRRNLRIILDWVPNHTSDEHPWFQASRSSRQDPHRDWYIWADPKPDGSPPNNWLSTFGGSAWTLDEGTGQYYFHAFLPEQPDLNWRNPQVREAMRQTFRFWLDRGVTGLRIDAIDLLLEYYRLSDNPANPKFDPHDALDQAVIHKYTRHLPAVHEVVAEMRKWCDEYPERILLGETYISIKDSMAFYGSKERPELHLPLNSHLLLRPWDADGLAAGVRDYAAAIPPHGWPNWTLGNHDMRRLTERARSGQERVAAMLVLTLRGTPIIYYGDEIGMHNVPVSPAQAEDPQGKVQPHRSRDVARTPMQWTAEDRAGFTTGEPWLPIAADYRKLNVAAQERDPNSLLNLYRRLIKLRRTEPALHLGQQRMIERSAPTIAYLRELEGRRLLVLLNMAGDSFDFDFNGHGNQGQILLSTCTDERPLQVQGKVNLRGNEGLIIALE